MLSPTLRPPFAGALALLLALSQSCFPDFEQYKEFAPAEEEDADGQNNGEEDASDVAQDTPDAPVDVPVDVTPDVEPDVPVDVTPDVEPDVPADVEPDVPADVPVDVTPDVEPDVPADVPVDVEPDVPVDVEPDVVEPPVLGAACGPGVQCPQGTECYGRLDGFDQGLCSVGCAEDGECPEGSACAAEQGLPFCVPTCEQEGAACDLPTRDFRDLTCSPWGGAPALRCAPDDDADGVLNLDDLCRDAADPEQADADDDGVGDVCDVCPALANPDQADADADGDGDLCDNCINAANPDQRDQDRDGAGDACDDAPLCPPALVNPAATEEAGLSRPLPSGLMTRGAWVYAPPLRAALYLGGQDAQGAPLQRALRYSLSQSAWSEDGALALPYPAYDLAATYDRARREVIATPGRAPGDGQPYTRLMALSLAAPEAPAWRLGVRLPRVLERPQISYLYPDKVLVAGYAPAEQYSNPRRLYFYLYDRSAGSVQAAADNAGQGYVEVADGDVGALSIAADHGDAGAGAFYVYNAGNRRPFYVVRADTGALETRFFVSPPFEISLTGPAYQQGTPLLLLQGPWPLSVIFRVDTGKAELLDLSARFSRQSELDLELPLLDNFAGLSYESLYLPSSRSLLLATTRQADGATEVQEFFLGGDCRPFANGEPDDNDRDGYGALADSCFLSGNADQADLDGDGRGDVCDDDEDGDGVPNASDSARGDLNNDNQPDLTDEDDDGDGLLDEQEAYPGDTDNDGLPNWLDQDDDDDLEPDAVELAQGSDPLDWTSLPGGERVAFVQIEEDGARTLRTVSLRNLRQGALGVPLSAGTARPAWPRMRPNGGRVLFLDQDDGGSLKVLDFRTPEIAPRTLSALGLEGGSAAFSYQPEGVEVPLIIYVRPGFDDLGEPAWELRALAEAALDVPDSDIEGSTLTLYQTPQRLAGLDALGASTLTTAAPASCAACAELFEGNVNDFPFGLGEVSAASVGGQEYYPRYARDGQALLFVAGPAGARRVWVFDPVNFDSPLEVASPEGWHVQSAAFAPDSRRVVMAARRTDEPSAPYQLYLLDRALDRWLPLTEGPLGRVEVDFAP